jgi:hypothetical protein
MLIEVKVFLVCFECRMMLTDIVRRMNVTYASIHRQYKISEHPKENLND